MAEYSILAARVSFGRNVAASKPRSPKGLPIFPMSETTPYHIAPLLIAPLLIAQSNIGQASSPLERLDSTNFAHHDAIRALLVAHETNAARASPSIVVSLNRELGETNCRARLDASPVRATRKSGDAADNCVAGDPCDPRSS